MPVQQRTKSGPAHWSTHDPACNHCRARKIKCGREHPNCANCKRDGVECGFSDQGKRINQIKLLVDNFGGIEGRLVSIEKELVRLTGTVQRGKENSLSCSHSVTPDGGSPMCQKSEREWAGIHESTDLSEEQLGAIENKMQKSKLSPSYQAVDAYAVGDRNHEPCTLLALCNELRDLNNASSATTTATATAFGVTSTSATGTQSTNTHLDMTRKETANGILTSLCSMVSTEEPLDLSQEPNTNPAILLPPKQFLVTACTIFFQQEDPAIDLFSQSNFWANVDRIYSKPVTSADDAWALCFNNIILLVLGAGQPGFGNDAVMGLPFAMPFISTMWCALAHPKILAGPKIINVQALALLSVTVQQHLQPSISETILARACVLARKMGLHQQRVPGAQIPLEQDEERLKVFRSLFLRDKTFSISRGISCCLPSLDCSISFALGNSLPTDVVMFARLQLGRLQEEIYRALYSSESLPLSTNQRRAAVCRIEESLRQWAESYEDPESAKVVRAVDVQLDFRASRIVALRSSSDPRHMEQVIHDARASCVLLSTAVARMKNVIPTTSEMLSMNLTLEYPSSLRQSESEHASLQIRSLAESFSVPAFFALVKNIIWPIFEDHDRYDIELLQTVKNIFQDLYHRTQANTYARKVSNTFQSLLALVHLLRPDLFEQKDAHQDQQQHYFPLTHQNSQPLPMIPISSTYFPNTSSAMTWQPLNFSGATQSAPTTTRNNPSALESSNPLVYEGRNHHCDITQQMFTSPDHYNNKQGFAPPNASNKDYHHQPHFSYLQPLTGEQQNANSHAF